MNQELPLFYRELNAFDVNVHGKLTFPEIAPNFKFARQTNIIPLLVHEAGLASRHYPLVFIPGQDNQPPVLAAVVGLGDGVNRYVDDAGNWRDNTYVPAWVRRYPFLAVRGQEGQDPLLAIDPKAEWLNDTGAEALATAEGKPTPRLERILAFQREFQLFAERTEAIARALLDAGVLEEGTLRVEPPAARQSEGVREIKGFLIVSEAKLKALPDEALLKLHKADALGLAYIQMLSLGSLPNLLEPVVPDSASEAKALAGKQKAKR